MPGFDPCMRGSKMLRFPFIPRNLCLQEGDLFNRIRKRATANQLFSEQEIMDMFVQVRKGRRGCRSTSQCMITAGSHLG